MNNRFFVLAMILTAALFAGCAGGTPHPKVLPQDAKKIYVKPFSNSTSQSALEDKLTLAVTNELINDGRYALVNSEKDADCVLSGDISKYELSPLTYNAAAATQQYKLFILVNVTFTDKAKTTPLWSEPMEGIQIYYDASQPGGLTEQDAQAVIWDNMSRDIVRRTADSLSSITSAKPAPQPQKMAPESGK